MIRHPEQSDTETFIGNDRVGETCDHLASLKTLRRGQVVFDIDGKRLPGYVPVFIGRPDADRYDAIMMARFNAIRGSR